MVKLESSALSKRCIVLSSVTEVKYLNPIPKVLNLKKTQLRFLKSAVNKYYY